MVKLHRCCFRKYLHAQVERLRVHLQGSVHVLLDHVHIAAQAHCGRHVRAAILCPGLVLQSLAHGQPCQCTLQSFVPLVKTEVRKPCQRVQKGQIHQHQPK
jgi:hypothetical protein